MIRHLRLVPFAAVAALLVAGCGGSDVPTASSALPASSATAAPVAGLTAPEQAFVDQVATIAPPLAENPERLARRGANSCTSLTDGRSKEDAVDQAVERFSGGTYTVTSEQAAAIVDAARKTVCAS